MSFDLASDQTTPILYITNKIRCVISGFLIIQKDITRMHLVEACYSGSTDKLINFEIFNMHFVKSEFPEMSNSVQIMIWQVLLYVQPNHLYLEWV